MCALQLPVGGLYSSAKSTGHDSEAHAATEVLQQDKSSPSIRSNPPQSLEQVPNDPPPIRDVRHGRRASCLELQGTTDTTDKPVLTLELQLALLKDSALEHDALNDFQASHNDASVGNQAAPSARLARRGSISMPAARYQGQSAASELQGLAPSPNLRQSRRASVDLPSAVHNSAAGLSVAVHGMHDSGEHAKAASTMSWYTSFRMHRQQVAAGGNSDSSPMQGDGPGCSQESCVQPDSGAHLACGHTWHNLTTNTSSEVGDFDMVTKSRSRRPSFILPASYRGGSGSMAAAHSLPPEEEAFSMLSRKNVRRTASFKARTYGG